MGILFLSILSNVGDDLLVSILTGVLSIATSFVLMRERVLKLEMKMDSMTEYVDRKNEVLDNKISELQDDIEEFKELNKETNKSLIENTAAIRELKMVLNLIREKIGVTI